MVVDNLNLGWDSFE